MKANRKIGRYKSLKVYINKGTVMELTKAYKFRIYPDAKRQSEIELQLTLSKEL